MKQQFSQLKKLPYMGSNLPALQMMHKVKIVVQLLILCITFTALFASESAKSDILGPESGVVDPRWRPDDKIMPLQMEYTFIPDKVKYENGEVLDISFVFNVDKESRGYVPNRKYIITSVFVPGFQIKSVRNLYWKILETDIDTLNTIFDDQPLAGKVTMRLIDYRDKEIKSSENSGMTLNPWVPETQKVENNLKGPPPPDDI